MTQLKSTAVNYRIVDGNEVNLLIHQDRPAWLAVNKTGALIARHLARGLDDRRIAGTLADRTGADLKDVGADVGEFLDGLSAKGFIGDSDVTPPASARQLRRLHINLTRRCNLKCRHCGASGNAQADMSGAEVKRLAKEAAGLGGVTVGFSGGEPLLRQDGVELIKYAGGRVKTTVTTNGLLLTKQTLNELDGLDIEWQISLDGADAGDHDDLRGAGAYRQAVSALELLAEAGLPATIFTVVTKKNIASLPDMLDVLDKFDARSIRFSPVQRLGRANNGWDELAPSVAQYGDFYRRLYLDGGLSPRVFPGLAGLVLDFPRDGYWCRLGESLAVDADGSVYPCSLLMAEEFKVGRMADDTLVEVMNSSKLERLVNEARRRRLDIERCRDCVWRAFCQGGCPASIYWERGTFTAADGLCELRDELYTTLLMKVAEAGNANEKHA